MHQLHWLYLVPPIYGPFDQTPLVELDNPVLCAFRAIVKLPKSCAFPVDEKLQIYYVLSR